MISYPAALTRIVDHFRLRTRMILVEIHLVFDRYFIYRVYPRQFVSLLRGLHLSRRRATV